MARDVDRGAAGETTVPDARWAAIRFAKVAAVLGVVSWASIEFLNRNLGYSKQAPIVFRGTAFLEGWIRWDGNWYQQIAQEGYSYTPGRQSSVAFFPAYPMAMRALGKVAGDVVLAGILLTFLSGLVSAVLLHHWFRLKVPDRPGLAKLALASFLLWPYAYYLVGAVYADAFFICAALTAFVLLEHDRPVLAALAGVVATAARPVGVGVVIGLVCVTLHRRGAVEGRRLHLRRLRPADGAVLLSGLGLAAWCAYLWRNWGDPFLFSTIQGATGWDQQGGIHTWLKFSLFDDISHLGQWTHDSIWPLDVRGYAPWNELVRTLGQILQGTLVLGFLALIPRVWRRVGWGYAAYCAVVIGMPLLGSKDFQGTGRYLLAAFPCYLVLADLLHEHPRFCRRVWFPASAVLLVVWTSLFARGYYVA